MCQGGQGSRGAAPSPHPGAHRGGCTAPALWGRRCRQGLLRDHLRLPGGTSDTQCWAPFPGHPSSSPRHGHRALFPVSPGCPLNPTVPPAPACLRDPCQAVPVPISSAAWGQGLLLAPARWGMGWGAPPAQPGTGMVWGGEDQPSPVCWGCRWGPEPRERSGFPGSALTDSEEHALPLSPEEHQGHPQPRTPGAGQPGRAGEGPFSPAMVPGCRGPAPRPPPLPATLGQQPQHPTDLRQQGLAGGAGT